MSTKGSPILVINNGSSSLKFSVLDPNPRRSCPPALQNALVRRRCY